MHWILINRGFIIIIPRIVAPTQFVPLVHVLIISFVSGNVSGINYPRRRDLRFVIAKIASLGSHICPKISFTS